MSSHVYGWDASDFDWDRGPVDVSAAYKDGIRFFTHKYTEGTITRHKHTQKAIERARGAGIPYIGGYHVVRSVPISAQVQNLLTYADSITPWWRDFDGWFWQCDVELWSYDAVSEDYGLAFATALKKAQNKPICIYASKGQYNDKFVGKGFPLWNANYGSNLAVHYVDGVPADTSSRWAGWETILQYGSNLKIGTQPNCDANVFKGTLAEFASRMGIAVTAPSGETIEHVAKMVGAIGGRVSALVAGGLTDPTDANKPIVINQQLKAVADDIKTIKESLATLLTAPQAAVVMSDEDIAKVTANILAGLNGLEFTAKVGQ